LGIIRYEGKKHCVGHEGAMSQGLGKNDIKVGALVKEERKLCHQKITQGAEGIEKALERRLGQRDRWAGGNLGKVKSGG